jgi:hypothetical protein
MCHMRRSTSARLCQQGHVAQLDNDKCQDEVGILGMRKLQI